MEHQPQWRHRSSTGLLPWPVHKDGAVQFPGCEKFHPASEGAKTYPSRPSGRYLTEYLTSKGHTIAERQSFTAICSSNTSSPSAGLDHRLRHWRAIRTAPLACPAHRVPQSTPKPFQRTSQLPPASSPDRRDREKDEQKKAPRHHDRASPTLPRGANSQHPPASIPSLFHQVLIRAPSTSPKRFTCDDRLT